MSRVRLFGGHGSAGMKHNSRSVDIKLVVVLEEMVMIVGGGGGG